MSQRNFNELVKLDEDTEVQELHSIGTINDDNRDENNNDGVDLEVVESKLEFDEEMKEHDSLTWTSRYELTPRRPTPQPPPHTK